MSKIINAITGEVKTPQQILDQYRKMQKAQKGPKKKHILLGITAFILISLLVTFLSEVLGYTIIAVGLAFMAWALSKPGNQEMAKGHANYLRMMVQQNEAVLFGIVISPDQWGLSDEEVMELIFSGNTKGFGDIESAWVSFMDLVWADIVLFNTAVHLSLDDHILKHYWH